MNEVHVVRISVHMFLINIITSSKFWFFLHLTSSIQKIKKACRLLHDRKILMYIQYIYDIMIKYMIYHSTWLHVHVYGQVLEETFSFTK